MLSYNRKTKARVVRVKVAKAVPLPMWQKEPIGPRGQDVKRMSPLF